MESLPHQRPAVPPAAPFPHPVRTAVRRFADDVWVLRTHELGDADLIVTLLAREHGKVRAVARSARSSRRRFGGTLEPLTRGRACWVEKPGRELHQLESIDGARSFAAMQADPLRQAACAVLVELASTFTHEGQAEPHMFRLLDAVLEALERERSPRVLLRYFEYWTLRVHGLLPDLDHCAVCGRDLPQGAAARVAAHGQVLCADCPVASRAGEKRLVRGDREFLEAVRRLAPAELPEGARPARPGGAVEALLRGTLEAFAERTFRTYRHFRAAEPRETG
jgi:DNA repair protein RecO (recombination protein O)